MKHREVGLCPTFLAEQFPHKQTAAAQTALLLPVAVLLDQWRHRGQVVFRMDVFPVLNRLLGYLLRRMFYGAFVLFLWLLLLLSAVIVVVLAVVVVIGIDELLVVLTRLHLAAIAFLSKGEVEVVALETDPVLVGCLRRRGVTGEGGGGGWRRGL